MARRNAVRIKIDGIKEIQGRLEKVGLTLRSPAVTREIQRGAEVMAARARARAPQDTGKLRQGIYTASTESYRFSQLSRNGRRINSPLRYPPRPGQVVVVSSVFYGLFVERGRKRRKGVGRQRAQRFFRVGVKEAQPVASAFILRRLQKLIESRWTVAQYTGASR
jgi:HK97 gp10 family phage protein